MGRGQGRVQRVDLSDMGLIGWPWGVREEKGGVLGKGTWGLMVLVTKMERRRVG